MTKPTGRPRGRPLKPKGQKRPAHRPTGSVIDFFKDPDRYLIAYYAALRLLGRSAMQAASSVAVARGAELWVLSDDERRKVNGNGKRRRKGWSQICEGALILSPPAHTSIEGRASAIRKKFSRAQGNPAAAHWLKIMAQAIAVTRALDGERMPAPPVLFGLGAEIETYVKEIER
jgi:hypothetical protein